jgi:hypothetical protein
MHIDPSGPVFAMSPTFGRRMSAARRRLIRIDGGSVRMAGDERGHVESESAARDEARRDTAAGSMHTVLDFNDHDGSRWTVREVEMRLADGTTRGSLIFESAHAVRRVWRYPDDWPSLSARDLEALSWGR